MIRIFKFYYVFLMFLILLTSLFSETLSTKNFFEKNKDAEKIYNSLKINGEKIKSLKLDFTQKIENNLEETKKEDSLDKGIIFFKDPNKFKISYKKGDVLYLFNGLNLKIFEKNKNQVLIMKNPMKTDSNFFGDEVIKFFKFDESLLKNYEINSFWEDDKKNEYIFVFLEKTTNYKVILNIDKKTLYPNMIIWDKEYVKFYINLSNISINLQLKDFDFEIEGNIMNKKNISFVEI
jgi:outer membrane lipoprotein-sorting protein